MNRKLSLLLIILLFLFTTFLPALAETPSKPPVCPVCNMQVADADKKFSAYLPNVSGMGPSTFDDIGCAVQSRNSECAMRQTTFDSNAVVYDFVTGEPVPAEKAFFAFKSTLKTPMGYGIVAFKDKTQAETFAAGHGKVKVVKWFELVDMKLQ
jgi:copper chaperone NosL